MPCVLVIVRRSAIPEAHGNRGARCQIKTTPTGQCQPPAVAGPSQRASLGARGPSSGCAAVAFGSGTGRGKEITAVQRSSGAPCRQGIQVLAGRRCCGWARGAALRGGLAPQQPENVPQDCF